MKAISSRKSSSKRRVIIIFIIVVALIGAGVAALYIAKQNQEAADRQKIIDRDKSAAKTNNSAKKDAIAKDKQDTDASSVGLPPNSTDTTSNQVPTSSALSVTIASTSQANGSVNATANTSGDGTCVFLYSAGDKDKPVTRQVAVSGGICTTSISQNEFSYLGNWKLTVTYYNGGNKAEASQDVTIH